MQSRWVALINCRVLFRIADALEDPPSPATFLGTINGRHQFQGGAPPEDLPPGHGPGPVYTSRTLRISRAKSHGHFFPPLPPPGRTRAPRCPDRCEVDKQSA